MAKKKEFFRRLYFIKRLGKKWRKPKGRQNKLRLEKKGKGKRVKVGFGSPKNERKRIIRIFSKKDIENIKNSNIDPKKNIILIASSVGKKKREELKNFLLDIFPELKIKNLKISKKEIKSKDDNK